MNNKTIGALGSLAAGSELRDLSGEWNRLDRDKQLIIAGIPVLVALFGLLLVMYVLFNWGGGSVLISAKTEYMEYTPLTEDPPNWYIPKATLFFKQDIKSAENNLNSDDDIFDADHVEPELSTVDITAGFLELSCGDELKVNRIARGNLSVAVSRLPSSTAGIVDYNGSNVAGTSTLPDQFTIHITIPPEYREQGESLNWPMAGLITAGRSVEFETNNDRGLLTAGNVQVMAKHFLASRHYLVESYDLRIGDQVVLPSLRRLVEKTMKLKSTTEIEEVKKQTCKRVGGSDNGFINVDPLGGLNTIISSRSEHAEIERYKTATLHVGNSLIKRFVNDQWFTLSWTLIIAFFAFYRRIIRSLLAGKYFDKKGGRNETPL